jgi:hypothetical protein
MTNKRKRKATFHFDCDKYYNNQMAFRLEYVDFLKRLKTLQ